MVDQLGEPANRDRLQRQLHVQNVPVPIRQHLFIHLLHRFLQAELGGWNPGELSTTGRQSPSGRVWSCGLLAGSVHTVGDYHGRTAGHW